jgi:tetratricopeptide (TPR) repeat protein
MLRAQGSWSLYSGLDPEIGGLNPQVGVEFDNYMRRPVVQGLRSEADLEAYWAKQSRDLLRERPGDVARVMLKKVVIFLTDREYSKEFDVYEHRNFSPLLAIPIWPGMGLLASLGFAGCLFCTKKRDVWLIIGLLALSIVSIFPFKVFGRYRMPCEALLIPFAGWWVSEAIRLGRLGEWKRVAVLAIPVALVGAVSWPDWLDLKGKDAARHDHLVGQFMAMSGQDRAAESAYRTSMEKWPWDADSPLRLARMKLAQGKREEAEALYKEALRREPHFPEAQAGLAEIYFHDYDMDAASKAVEACLQEYPNFVPAWQIKAWIAKAAGDTDQEIQCYARAVEEGGGGVVYFQLARRLAEMGRTDEARNLYEAVIKGDRFSAAERKWARDALGEL